MVRATSWVAAAFLLAGCDRGATGAPAPSATAADTPSASATGTAPPPASTPAAPPPAALDVEALKKALKCAATSPGPCEVLASFADCTAWEPASQSGDARWLGEAFVARKGAFTTDFAMLRAKRVPASAVAPGQLGARVGFALVPEAEKAAREHAEKAVRAYKRGDVTLPTNAAVRYVKERGEWPELFASRAAASQVHLADDGGAHVCALRDQRLLVVRLAAAREHPADGLYAVLWPVSW
jgi:hypothetical protein